MKYLVFLLLVMSSCSTIEVCRDPRVTCPKDLGHKLSVDSDFQEDFAKLSTKDKTQLLEDFCNYALYDAEKAYQTMRLIRYSH